MSSVTSRHNPVSQPVASSKDTESNLSPWGFLWYTLGLGVAVVSACSLPQYLATLWH